MDLDVFIIRAVPNGSERFRTVPTGHYPAFRLPCCAIIPLFAVPFFYFHLTTLLCAYFSSHLLVPCSALILFSLTLLCAYFIFTYPAVPSFYSHLPAALLFYFHLPCCSLYFLRTYPAAPSFYSHLPCCALIFLSHLPISLPIPRMMRGITTNPSGSAPLEGPVL